MRRRLPGIVACKDSGAFWRVQGAVPSGIWRGPIIVERLI